MDIPLVLSNYYKGQEWTLNGDGYEGLIWCDERNTLPKPTLEELTTRHTEYMAAQPLRELREERDKRLAKCDWVVMSDVSMSEEAKQAWLDYRQALRDLPANTTDPENPVWPQAPSP